MWPEYLPSNADFKEQMVTQGGTRHSIPNLNTEVNDLIEKSGKQECGYMTRRIGSTTYRVRVVFPDGGGETMEEKILRMIRNEGLAPAGNCGMMGIPQMSRQSERSA